MTSQFARPGSLALATLVAGGALVAHSAAPALAAEACPQTDTGITVPKGFCATVFADNVGHARQMVVAPDGTVYVNTWSGVYYNNDTPPAGRLPRRAQGYEGSRQARTRSRASARRPPRAGTAAPASHSTRMASTRRSTTASCATR